jgi:hypothetical protein
MCWIGKNEPQYASTDIKVFKLVRVWKKNMVVSAYHHDFKWELGKVYETDMSIKTSNDGYTVEINRGFHCYDPEEVHLIIEGSMAVLWSTWKKLDEFSTRTTSCDIDLAVMECVIPAGSTYYENTNGEMVTDKITPISVVGIIDGYKPNLTNKKKK